MKTPDSNGSGGIEQNSRGPRKRRNRKKKGAVKLSDIARAAGVSPATVSRSMNQPSKVSPEARARIEKAISQMNWVPHAGARALASHSTKLVGVIVATLGNPNVAIGLQAIERRLARDGYSMMIACDDLDADKQIRQARMMLERGVDALILHGEGHRPDVWQFLGSQDLPVIVNHSFSPIANCLTVGYDAYREFAKVTEHLLNLGHRKFGMMMLTSPQHEAIGDREVFGRIKTKHRGIVETLAAANVKIRDEHITNTFFGINAGRKCFRQIMSTENRPTALICLNDQMAVGAVIEARHMGISVPGDVSVVGCDDIELASLLDPPLTTIRPPDESMGTLAAECALECIHGKRAASGRRELQAELILRASTAAPGVR